MRVFLIGVNMQKWDYQIINAGNLTDWMELRDALKEFGDEGWELVTVTENPYIEDSDLYIFKKPLEE